MLSAQQWLKPAWFPWFTLSERTKRPHTLDLSLLCLSPHDSGKKSWQTSEFSSFCLLFCPNHKDPLHCPQKCLSLLRWVSVYQKTNKPAIGGLARTLLQWIPDIYSPCQLLFIIYKPQWDYHKNKKLHSFMRATWNHIISFSMYSTPGRFCNTGIYIQVKWTFYIVFPGKFFQAPMFKDPYLPPQETCLSVVSWREWYVFEIISIATSKRNTGLSFFLLLIAPTLFRMSVFPNPFSNQATLIRSNGYRRVEKGGESCWKMDTKLSRLVYAFATRKVSLFCPA